MFYAIVTETRPSSKSGHLYLSDVSDPIAADSTLLDFWFDRKLGSLNLSSYREVSRVGGFRN